MSETALKKSHIRLIKLLGDKKGRRKHGLFVAEGDKLVRELLSSHLEIVMVFALSEWLQRNKELLNRYVPETVSILYGELLRISFQKTPNQVLALVKTSEINDDPEPPTGQLSLFLDNISDPGNLGTIIRIADWFGIRNMVCSKGSADLYNPKVVQATMGAIARVRVYYVDQTKYFEDIVRSKIPVYGAFLEGENLFNTSLPQEAVLVMGNESGGISDKTASYITHRITIPTYPPGTASSESLNVAIATSVICSEFRRQAITGE